MTAAYHDIQKRIDMDLLSRSSFAIVVYLIIFPAILYPFDLFEKFPLACWGFAGTSIGISLVRLIHLRLASLFYDRFPVLWITIFQICSLLHALTLSALFALVTYDVDFQVAYTVTLVVCAGMSSAAISSLSPNLFSAMMYPLVVLIPTITINLFSEDTKSTGWVMLIYVSYLMLLAIRTHKEYMRTFSIEEQIEQKKNELEIKNNNIQTLLSNMRLGLFTIQVDGTIHHEYSAYLKSIFEADDIAGQSFSTLLFSHADLSNNVINQTVEAVKAIIGEEPMNFSFNEGHLCTEYSIQINEARKVLALDWNPIIEDDLVTKLMVSVRDVTALKEAEKAADEKSRELNMIGEVINLSAEDFDLLKASTCKYLVDNRQTIDSVTEFSEELKSRLFRNMHTIKGNARTYGLSYLSDLAHEIETRYSAIMTTTGDVDKAVYQSDLDVLEKRFNEYVYVFLNILGRGRTERIQAGIKTLEGTLDPVLSSLPSIAMRLDKAIPLVAFDNGNTEISPSLQPVIRDCMMHFLRNSIDHGLELPQQRIQSGKRVSGTITIRANKSNNKLVIQIDDDGQGLDIKRLKNIAISRSLIPEEKLNDIYEISNLVFESGVSTRKKVTEISGRGVGLDAVKETIKALGGEVALILLKSDEVVDDQFIPFMFEVRFPLQ